jgi:hypothetical protein
MDLASGKITSELMYGIILWFTFGSIFGLCVLFLMLQGKEN